MQAVVLLSPKSSLVSILMGHDGSVTTIRGTHTPPPAVPSTQHPAREVTCAPASGAPVILLVLLQYRPWGSPGGNTGVRCHFLLWAKSLPWCLTLCDPMGYVARQAPLCIGFSRQEY